MINLVDACRGIVDDTIAFLDLAYEKINSVMAPLLENPDYQRLWGWRDRQPAIMPIPARAASVATPATIIVPTINVSMSSAGSVDHKQYDLLQVQATHSPPGSGKK